LAAWLANTNPYSASLPPPRLILIAEPSSCMIPAIGRVAAATALAFMLTGGPAAAQKAGGVLRIHLWDSPPNVSMLDGANPLAARTMMPVFNNLAMFDQHAKQSRLDAVVPA